MAIAVGVEGKTVIIELELTECRIKIRLTISAQFEYEDIKKDGITFGNWKICVPVGYASRLELQYTSLDLTYTVMLPEKESWLLRGSLLAVSAMYGTSLA